MIVKMKFLSISGPRTDIDRMCQVYLSRHEMQLENAIAELKTTENLIPFAEVNPYREPLNKAEEFIGLLEDGKVEPDQAGWEESRNITETIAERQEVQDEREIVYACFAGGAGTGG